MSATFFVGVVGPGFWSYTASLMAKHLHYARLLLRLDVSGELTEEELGTARELRDFFAQLARDGEEENYVAAIRFYPPKMG